ncbi:MAG: hypothetical protein KatS3mg030_301 [Saprospiraceae bacterium]|nr:MAG: hypothetical protein KatS3mg030_301 [Saprospiraceae bacterium]
MIDEFGCPALVKIDVEGHELAVFQGLGRPLPQVVFEANLPVFLHETLEILRLLQALDAKVQFNYAHSFQLQLESFVPAEVLAEKVLHLPKGTYDIVVRMSSYGKIYRS